MMTLLDTRTVTGVNNKPVQIVDVMEQGAILPHSITLDELKEKVRVIFGDDDAFITWLLNVEDSHLAEYCIAIVNQDEEWKALEKQYGKMVLCTACNGTGANHYDDNNPCGVCDASGVVPEEDPRTVAQIEADEANADWQKQVSELRGG